VAHHPSSRFRAVLFDLDGVLVDSYEVWFAAVNTLRVRFGFPALTREQMNAVWGQGVGDDLRNLYPGRTREEVLKAYEDALPAAIGRMVVNSEARTALEGLARRGVKRSVVTNTQASLAGGVLRRVGLDVHVDACVAVAPGLREKPAPDMLLKALELLGVPATEALMVGDTDYDQKAAEAAGTAFLRYEIRKGTSLTQALDERLRA
jgi:HAD superfamily hydrolase (TIGR01509 family)